MIAISQYQATIPPISLTFHILPDDCQRVHLRIDFGLYPHDYITLSALYSISHPRYWMKNLRRIRRSQRLKTDLKERFSSSLALNSNYIYNVLYMVRASPFLIRTMFFSSVKDAGDNFVI